MSTHRIEAGVYKGRGVAGSEQYGQTSNGNDQIVLELVLSQINERVSTFLVFSDKAAPYAVERLRALGWRGENLANLAGLDANEVTIEVKYEMHQGEERMKVQILIGGAVVLKDRLDDKGKKAFAARYAALAKTTGSPVPAAASRATGGGAQAVPVTVYSEAAAEDDGIPF